MPTSTIRSTYNVGGIALGSEVTRTQESIIGQEHTLTAGSDGVQASYTGVAEITVTMTAGYVIGDAETADVYWTDSTTGVPKVKYGATTALAGDIITVTVGAGDDYPDDVGLAMVITQQQDVDIDFDGDLVEIMAASCDKLAHIEWNSGAAVTITGTKIPAGEAWDYILNGEYANALAGEVVTSASVSTGDSDNNGTLRIGVLHSSA